ncbi:MAG: hypothetical protein H0X63_09895 [Flavobacteriales bacterium]|nr:hypothetical protein [Flavobacteriales bacterium]
MIQIQTIGTQLKNDECVEIEMSDYVLTNEWPANTSLTLNPVELPNGFIAYYEFVKINT